jgi:hypothetical protein
VRFAWALLLLAACAHDRGPAWPKPYVASDAVDGGESLAPKPKPYAIAAAVADAISEDAPAPAVAPRPVAAPTPTPAAPVMPPTFDDDAIDGGEIIIEIDD